MRSVERHTVKLAAQPMLHVEGVEGFEGGGLGQAHAGEVTMRTGRDATMSQATTPEPASARGGSSVRLIHGASPEQWQFFAFVFAALAMLVPALLDALPWWCPV
jgi:hypothetical protein